MLIKMSCNTHFLGENFLVTSALYVALKTEQRKVVSH